MFENKGQEMQQGQEDLKKLIKESVLELLGEERLGLCGT
jgi:RNase P/RNase MRP subunit POP5